MMIADDGVGMTGRQLNEALRGRPDFEKLVEGMAGRLDVEPSEPEQHEPPPPGELPTTEEVLRDLEDFLKDVRREGEDEAR